MKEPTLASDDAIREQAYLVERGVRALALVGRVAPNEAEMLAAASKLEILAIGRYIIPFVFNRGDGGADYGYAAAPWVFDLYRWITTSSDVPKEQRTRITGLLLGYSAEAIKKFEDRQSIRFLKLLCRLPQLPSRSLPAYGTRWK